MTNSPTLNAAVEAARGILKPDPSALTAGSEVERERIAGAVWDKAFGCSLDEDELGQPKKPPTWEEWKADQTDHAKGWTARVYEITDAILAVLPSGGRPFQARVRPWMLECFGPVIPFDKEERGDRLLEEVFELLQSGGYDPERVLALRDYVWGRPVGEPTQEVGGVMVTLAAYCLAFGLEMHTAGETELARIWTKVAAIRAKQAAKPTGSALPVAFPDNPA